MQQQAFDEITEKTPIFAVMTGNGKTERRKKDIFYRLLRVCWVAASFIPLPIMYILSDLLFLPFYYLVRYRRAIVRRNITESFPDAGAKEARRLERRFYRFFLDLFFEICKYASISKKAIGKRMVFENVDEINELLLQGKSVSLYLGHYGNWEWVSSLPLHLAGDAVAGQIYHKLKSLRADRLMLENRGRMGAVCVEMRNTLRWISGMSERGATTITGYIADQSPRKRDARRYLDFLNHCVPVLTGAEKITMRYGMEAYYLDVVRVRRGYYRAAFVRMADDPASLPEGRLTEIYYGMLEGTIRRRPEFFLWSHNRFRNAKK